MNLVQYGGAIFNARCLCGMFVKASRDLSVNRFMSDFIEDRPNTAPAHCNRCGDIRIPFVRFENHN